MIQKIPDSINPAWRTDRADELILTIAGLKSANRDGARSGAAAYLD
jgi:hypothetical protein